MSLLDNPVKRRLIDVDEVRSALNAAILREPDRQSDACMYTYVDHHDNNKVKHCIAGQAFVELGLKPPDSRGADEEGVAGNRADRMGAIEQLLLENSAASAWAEREAVEFSRDAVDLLQRAQSKFDQGFSFEDVGEELGL